MRGDGNVWLALVHHSQQVEKRPKEQLLAAGFEHVIKTLNDDVSWCEPGAIATGMRGTNASSGAEHREGTATGPAPHPASVRIRQDVMRRDSGDPLPLLYITFDFLGCSKSAGYAAVWLWRGCSAGRGAVSPSHGCRVCYVAAWWCGGVVVCPACQLCSRHELARRHRLRGASTRRHAARDTWP